MGIFSLLLSISYYSVCLPVTYLFLLVCYRLVLHPLRQYPGPLLARITDAYGGLYAARRRLYLATWTNHKQYGPVVRQGPNRLVFNTVTALHDIYQNPRVAKSSVYLFARMGHGPSVFDELDRDKHRRKRKIVGMALTERSMREFEPSMQSQLDVFLRIILESSKKPKPMDMSEICERLGTDIVGELAFGYPLKSQTEKANRFLLKGLNLTAARINVLMQFPVLSLADGLLRRFARKHRGRYLSTISTMIRSRVSQDQDAQRDLYSFAAGQLEVDLDDLRHSELWAEAIFFIIAGGSTSATAMTALFFYLSRYPECCRLLREEIRSEFDSGSNITALRVGKCEYLRACINETLRMSPPSVGTLWRQVPESDTDDTPFVVDGHVIPKGTLVGVNHYCLHHNEAYFPDPFIFKPERWLGAREGGHGTDPSTSDTMPGFAPFSLGARGCAGKAMAYQEVGLVVAKTMYYFDFQTAPGYLGLTGARPERPHEFQLFDNFTASHNGPVLEFTPRPGAQEELATFTVDEPHV
ncbi:cytochrome P450 [Xylariomycetidae sp. FL2044]|nr:cytochrome P450 [Xylariomycetidae sp. FL2044]